MTWPNQDPYQQNQDPYQQQPGQVSGQPYNPGYPQPGQVSGQPYDPSYAQAGYQAGYPAQQAYAGYGYPPAAPVKSTNGLAVASLVLSLAGLATCGVTSLIGAILGHVARKQIRQNGQDGDGLAKGGIIAGWIIFALALIGGGLYVALIVWAVNNTSNMPDPYSTT